MVIIDEDEHLAHYGILRRSGRYPWGSGSTENIRHRSFLDHIEELRKQGLSETEIARGFDISTTQLRAAKTIAKNQQLHANIAMAERLKAKGYSNGAIAERMNLAGESSVRALLAPGVKDRADILIKTSDMLKEQVAEKGLVDIGVGVENYLGISKEKLNTAVMILREQGYEVRTVKVPQPGTGLDTTVKVLAPPGTSWGDVQRNRGNIKSITEFSDDGGHSYAKILPPLAVNPKRVGIRYAEEGGDQADGVIYVRPGVKDLSLGGKTYAQVRIQVGDGHYLKGMAMYKDDLPDGVDLLFNTNKSSTGNKLDVMKPLNRTKDGDIDPDLPFGSVIRQIGTDLAGPNAKVTSAMNIVNDEGQWDNWSRNLSTQMLSKQSPSLAKQQLDVTFDRRKNELENIRALNNPTIKKKLLESYADDTDSAAVHLKAAALPRQATRVILPVASVKPGEVYAPSFNNGERVALIRYPHGGTFEIPELTVNNKNREAIGLLGDARDAIGIHHSVAQRLSGADFDGDTVIVIPNNLGKVKSSPALERLRDFDPKVYKLPDDSPIPRITSKRKQQEMGNVSNLITDMTIRGASHDDIARAVKHSMVVIDAEKHNLNYKQSAIDNGIAQLKAQYQGGSRAGASTLISRKKSEERVNERKARPSALGGPIDRETGRRVFVETGATRIDRDGNVVPKKVKVKKLAETDDAHTLSSGTPIERLYADHSNRLKGLANEARLDALNTPSLRYSPSAKQTYSREVESLTAKLLIAERNAPRERQAIILANSVVKAKREAQPDLEPETLKKIKYQALEEARVRTGAGKERVVITQPEWDAIQAGAISDNRLQRILNNADIDQVRQLASPRVDQLMTSAKTQRAQSMLALGYTRAEVASALGVSLTTLDTATVG